MGLSLSGTHTIFFIVSIIVAGAISGVFMAVTTDISLSLTERGDRLQDQLDTEFKIINDPNNIPTSGVYYVFYLKNIGGNELTTTNQTFQIFVNGDIVITADYYFADNSIKPSEYTSLYVDKSLASGDHTLRAVGPHGIDDEFSFTT